MKTEEKLSAAYESIRNEIPFEPAAALILGSGLGGFAEGTDIKKIIPYSSIEGFPVSTVSGHKGQFVFSMVNSVPTVIMQGRVHFYEGYPIEDVVMPVRLMKLMGAKILMLTNAAGGVNESFSAGDLMMITDQISKFVPSSLKGPNIDSLGTRFPDMSSVYDRELCEIIRQSAGECGIDLKEGTYIQFTGPEYETPAEVRMCRLLGADAVGMSTACEATAAVHAGMRVCGISCITNMAAGIQKKPLSHTEVKETGDRISEIFGNLVRTAIGKMA